MEKIKLLLCTFFLFGFIATSSWASVMNGAADVDEIGAGSYSLPYENYGIVASQDIDLDHYWFYTWGFEDFDEGINLSSGVQIVFHEIYNWIEDEEDNILNVYLYDNHPAIDLGWNEYGYDGQDPSFPTFSGGTHLGSYHYDNGGPVDVVFTVTDPELLAMMQNDNYWGLAIDPDCHYYGEGITVNAPVPEPQTMLLLGTGLLGLASLGRKKIFKQ